MAMSMPLWLLGVVLRDPGAKIAVVGSFVPFSTPMLMTARLAAPAGVPWWQPALAAVLVTALTCVWAAGRVFRVGLLMQGKSVSFADLAKWIARGEPRACPRASRPFRFPLDNAPPRRVHLRMPTSAVRPTCTLLALALSACGAPAAPRSTRLVVIPAATGRVAPSSAPAEAPPVQLVDVDREDCAAKVRGTLYAQRGALLFRSGVATPSHPGPATDEDVELRWLASWRHGTTRLGPDGPRITSEDGTRGGTFSTLVPTADARRAVAVRVRADRAGAPVHELVVLRADALAPEVIYAPGGRLLLMGRIEGAFVLAAAEGAAFRLVALDGGGKVIARSRPVVLEERVTEAKPAELGLPWAAPSGPKRLLLTCEQHHLCEVALRGAALTLRDTGVGAAEGLSLTAGGDLWIEQKGHKCSRLRTSQARPGPAVPCPEGREDAFDGGLPVDGALASGGAGDAPRCRVRHEIALPELHEEDEALRGGATIAVTREPELKDDVLSLEVVTRADRIAFAWALARAAVVRRDVGVALPPGSVEVTPAQLEGRPAWRVRVRAPYPVHPSRHCEQGRWVIRASYGPVDQPGGDEAWVNRYQELGHCE